MRYNTVLQRMRIFCPLAFMFSLGTAWLNYEVDQTLMFGVCCFCAGVNLMLTWIEWRVLKPM